jgi:hypothetical protein
MRERDALRRPERLARRLDHVVAVRPGLLPFQYPRQHDGLDRVGRASDLLERDGGGLWPADSPQRVDQGLAERTMTDELAADHPREIDVVPSAKERTDRAHTGRSSRRERAQRPIDLLARAAEIAFMRQTRDTKPSSVADAGRVGAGCFASSGTGRIRAPP